MPFVKDTGGLPTRPSLALRAETMLPALTGTKTDSCGTQEVSCTIVALVTL